MTTRSNWFEDFFHGVALDLWRGILRPEQTRLEADFLEQTLGAKARLLDAPCGNGRHCLQLAQRGCRMTGVDISAEFIREAQAAAKRAKVPARFVKGDLRRLRWDSEFDGAFCLGNSFGYFEHPQMLAFIHGVARALKPGGRFVIETGMTAESLLPNLEERMWYQVGNILFAIENRYQAGESCLETEALFVRNGKSEVRTWWHWVYTVGEIRRMLGEAGLAVRDLYGSYDRQPFKAGDHLLIIVGEKLPPASSRRNKSAVRRSQS